MHRSSSFLGLCAAGVLTAAAPALGAGEVPQGPVADAAAALDTSTVTLITGHRIRVDSLPEGRHAVTVVPTDTGVRANVKVAEHADGLYVIPAEAQRYLAAGSLDRELFNVTGLIAQGYDDDDRDSVPLIVTYAPSRGARAAAPAVPDHSTRAAVLESVHGVAAVTPKDEAARFWAGVADDLDDGSGSRRAAGDSVIESIWLDGTVRADLAQSVLQIGAPEAWAAGYDGAGVDVAVLDTGYDPAHPDLDGRVSAAQDFTGSGVADGHGHGTHVAATVAGTGAASDGLRPGVAPGAELLIGKVLGDDGSGQNSWLIDGMEWAVAQGADVVSMSLSSEVTDGSDPMSQAVNSLTESSGALFVAAAGNEGPGAQSVRAPGVADSALSVGAVDRNDALADFSSRGPRSGDHAVKPEITAPGVGIVAARAAGTSLGDPVNHAYTALSGTSMATPHVAGAAAILRQRHPGWRAAELKAALMGSSRPVDGYTVYEQGAGRVDVARAVAQTAFADTGKIEFGSYDWPHDGTDPVATRTVTYVNDAPEPIALDIAAELIGEEGGPAPAGMFSVDSTTLEIPAGGSASVQVRLDPNLGEPSLYSGRITARSADDAIRIHTAVGLYKEPEMIELTVEAVAQNGTPAGGSSSAELWSLDTDLWETGFFGRKGGGSGPATFRVRPGTYSLAGYLFTQDEARRSEYAVAVVGDAELQLTEDTHLVLDGRDARQVTVDTPQPTEHQGLTLGIFRRAGDHEFNMRYLFDRYMDDVYAAPMDQVERGEFEFTSHWELYAPEFTMRLKPDADEAMPAEYAIGSPRLDGHHVFRVVAAGTGSAADLEGIDLEGALALLRRADGMSIDDQVSAVARAGAAAAVVHHDQPGRLLLRIADDAPIPSFTVGQDVGEEILARLAAGEKLRVDVRATAVSPYLFDLMFAESGEIPAGMGYTAEPGELARLDTEFVASGPDHLGNEARHGFRPYDNFSLRVPRVVQLPSRRTEWVSAGDTTWRQLVWAERELIGGMAEALTSYAPGQVERRSWFAPVVRPGVPDDVETFGRFGMPGFREDDRFTILVRSFLDGDGNNGDEDGTDVTDAWLFRDGELVAQRDGVYGTWPADAAPSEYRLELDVERTAPWWRHSTSTSTAWTFTSSRPDSGQREMLPLLQVDYDLETDLRAALNGRDRLRIGMNVHRQGDSDHTDVAAGLRLWVSYDDGTTWESARVIRRGGRFAALIDHRRDAEHVSLRVEAWDADHNMIEQTVERAYLLSGR